MAEISETQEKQLREAFAGRSESELASEGAREKVQPASRDAFCDNWPDIKRVLTFLKNLPGVPSKPIDNVIKIGDIAYEIVC